jgi:hypothetical protein
MRTQDASALKQVTLACTRDAGGILACNVVYIRACRTLAVLFGVYFCGYAFTIDAGTRDMAIISGICIFCVFFICKTINFPFVSFGCETWSLTLREEHRLRVLRIFLGPKEMK